MYRVFVYKKKKNRLTTIKFDLLSYQNEIAQVINQLMLFSDNLEGIKDILTKGLIK